MVDDYQGCRSISRWTTDPCLHLYDPATGVRDWDSMNFLSRVGVARGRNNGSPCGHTDTDTEIESCAANWVQSR